MDVRRRGKRAEITGNVHDEILEIEVFDLSYLPVAAVGTWQVRYHEKIVKI